jgi:acyl carrier protein
MTREDIRILIRNIVADLLDNPSVVLTDSTVAADLADWDSINHVRLLISLEQELGFRFTNEEAEGLSNFGDLFDLVQGKLGT